MRQHAPWLLHVIAALLIPLPVATAAPVVGAVTARRLLAAGGQEWLTGGRDYQQSYYSPLSLIDATNVGRLGFAWQYEIDTEDGFEATPIVVDEVMFSSGPRGVVFALDARTGKERWRFSPSIDAGVMSKLCCGRVNRGVAVWEGRVYVASLDGYLYALSAESGRVLWKMDTITDRSRGYSVTGAPRIAGGVVVIGNAGAEYDARGYVTGYDLASGKQRWRFFTVPGDPKRGFESPDLAMAARTWSAKTPWQVGARARAKRNRFEHVSAAADATVGGAAFSRGLRYVFGTWDPEKGGAQA